MSAPEKAAAARLARTKLAHYQSALDDLARVYGEAAATREAEFLIDAAATTIARLAGPTAAAAHLYTRADALMAGAVPEKFQGDAGKRNPLDRRQA